MKEILACVIGIFAIVWCVVLAVLLNPVVWVVIILIMILNKMGG